MKTILDPNTPTHWEVDLHKALCGSGWLQATNIIENMTCEECKRLLTQRRDDYLKNGDIEDEGPGTENEPEIILSNGRRAAPKG